jgi:hypothetical protein
MRRRTVFALAACAIAAFGAGAVGAYLASRPVALSIRLLVDDPAREALSAKIAEYGRRKPKTAPTILPREDAGPADMTVGPAGEGRIWRIRGWRLWARLETLASLEKRMGMGVIAALRGGTLQAEEFTRILEAARSIGIVPFVVPSAPAEYSTALDRWMDPWGTRVPEAFVSAAGSIRTAADEIGRGAALFAYAPDQFGSLLRKTADSHPEAFPPPGLPRTEAPAAGTVVDRIRVAPGLKRRTASAAEDLAAFLTSRGVSRSFAESLPGEFPVSEP